MSQTEDYDVRWGISAEADKFLRNNSDSVFMHCLQKERMRKKKKSTGKYSAQKNTCFQIRYFIKFSIR